MPSYAYRARDANGELVEGIIEASTPKDVASHLLNNNITPIDIDKASASDDRGLDLNRLLERRKSPDLMDLILFCRQMYTLTKSGVPMISALTGLIETTRNYRLVAALKEVLKDLESGQDLSSAFAEHADIFPGLFISMVRVGENTGRLDESFMRLAMHYEREKDTRERIKTAFRYPTFVFIAIAIAIGVINILVIPVFASMFERANADLPWQTRLLVNLSDFFVATWPMILGACVVAVVGLRQYIKTRPGRYRWDRFKLNIPIIGDIINRATLARFSRTLSMAMSSGVPVLNAFQVVASAVDNSYIEKAVLDMRGGIERGDSITLTARRSGMFTPLVLQMLSVGEETGRIDTLLTEVAEFYEREVDYDIKNLSSAIEPIVIVMIGIMVTILALGVFLPMWDLSTTL
ncbi:MAG: type II secretion system F family protein [Pseudomonadales bacterium]